MNQAARVLIVAGLIFIAAGGLLLLLGKIPGVGKLPGDISVQKDNFQFYAPITTCILISIILSLLFWIFGKFR